MCKNTRREILDEDDCRDGDEDFRIHNFKGTSYGLRERKTFGLERHGENIAQTAMASNSETPNVDSRIQ